MTTSAPPRRRRTSSASTPASGVSSSFLEQPRPGRYVLKLYVTGMTPRSIEAVAAVKDVCEGLTLVRQSPLPARRLVGNLNDPERVREGLQLGPRRA